MSSGSAMRPQFPEVGVLALVPDQWGAQWQTRHHVLARLADYFQVVWVNRPPQWRELIRRRARHGQPAAVPRLQVYDPELWLPEFFHPAWLANITLRERLRRARNLLVSRGCRRIVLYVWHPDFASALDLVAHDLSCYHIDDEYCYSPQDRLQQQEVRLLSRVGQVFMHSPAMLKKKGPLNKNTEFIPNGVDYGSYAALGPEPEDLRSIPRPRLGYSGVVKKQLDWPLLMELSARHPEWSFVFVGAISRAWKPDGILSAMSARANVHFLGPKTTAELSHYPQHFQVCLMPYRLDGYTRFIYPLKLHEYLASGAPVVGSRLPTLEHFDHVVSLAQGAEEWSGAIAQALSPARNSADARQARQAVARAHDWSAIVGRIAAVIGARLGLKVSGGPENGFESMPARENSPELPLFQ